MNTMSLAMILLSSLLVYGIVGVLYPLYPEIWHATGSDLVAPNQTNALFWLIALSLLMLYLSGYRMLEKYVQKPFMQTNKLCLWGFIFLSMITWVTTLTQPLDHSFSLNQTIQPGWLWHHYHINPYFTIFPQWLIGRPLTHGIQDPMALWLDLPHQFTLCHAPWGITAVSVTLNKLGHGHYYMTCWLFKCLYGLAHLLNAFLISRISYSPDRLKAAYLYAFNPVILLYGLVNGAESIMLITLLLLGSWLLKHFSHWGWLGLSLIFGAATLHPYGIGLWTLTVVWLTRHQAYKNLLIGLALNLLLAAIAIPVFSHDLRWFQPHLNVLYTPISGSFWAFLFHLWPGGKRMELSQAYLAPSLIPFWWSLCILIWSGLLLWLWKKGSSTLEQLRYTTFLGILLTILILDLTVTPSNVMVLLACGMCINKPAWARPLCLSLCLFQLPFMVSFWTEHQSFDTSIYTLLLPLALFLTLYPEYQSWQARDQAVPLD